VRKASTHAKNEYTTNAATMMSPATVANLSNAARMDGSRRALAPAGYARTQTPIVTIPWRCVGVSLDEDGFTFLYNSPSIAV
jgi:hypothetical protein